MLNDKAQTTAVSDAIPLAAVAMTKSSPLIESDERDQRSVDLAGQRRHAISGDRGLYEGDLGGYFRALFFDATNLNRPYHNLRHMLHVTWRKAIPRMVPFDRGQTAP